MSLVVQPVWADRILCTRFDIEAELPGIDSALQGDHTERDMAVTNAIAGAKIDLTERIMALAPKIFTNSTNYYPLAPFGYFQWLTTVNSNWSHSEQLLDYLANPEILVNTAVAATCVRLFTSAQWNWNSFSSTANTMDATVDRWEKRLEKRFSDVWPRLWFDLNQNGIIDKNEQSESRTVLTIC